MNAGAPAPLFKSDAPPSSGPGDLVSQDGAASYAVALAVPPGRNGAEPAVALHYSSRAPLRGGIAAGWQLPIPTIHVDTSQGRGAGPADATYMVDGRRLIEVDEPHKAPGARTFRLQDDASFTRYEKVSDGSEPGHWIVRTTDGTTLTFGDDDTARDLRSDGAPGDATYGGEGRWFLTSTRDALGNTVTYTYEKVKAGARNGAVANVDVDIVPTRIEYGKNVNVAGSVNHGRIDFQWQTALDTCPGSNVPKGAQFTYRTGIRTYEGARKLLAIRALVNTNPTNPTDADWKPRRELLLGYAAAAEACDQLHGPMRVLDRVTERAYAPDGSVTELPTQTFEYGALEMDFSGPESAPADRISLSSGKDPHSPDKPGGWPALDSMRLDLDGDGTPEYVTADLCHTFPQMPWAAGAAQATDRRTLAAWEGCSLTAQVTHRSVDRGGLSCGSPTDFFGYRFMDVTGDGLPDLVAALNYQKGGYLAEDDASLPAPYRAAYGSCSALPPPPCVDAQGDHVPCLLNAAIQRAISSSPRPDDHSWDGFEGLNGAAPGLYTRVLARSTGDDDGPSDDGGDEPPPNFNECENQGSCSTGECSYSTASKYCCKPANCPSGQGPSDDPPNADGQSGSTGSTFGLSFKGLPPTVQENIFGRSPGGDGRCGHVPDMHCGYYVLYVFKNKGTSADGSWFERAPQVVYSPVPLESDQMTSGQGAGPTANASAWRATTDINGDGIPDAIYQIPNAVIPPKYATKDLHVWFGKGDGSFARSTTPGGQAWSMPDSGVTTGDPTDGEDRSAIELSGASRDLNVGVVSPTEAPPRIPIGTRDTFRDINGDGLLDYVRGAEVFYNTGSGFEKQGTKLAINGSFTTLSQRVRVTANVDATGADDAFSSTTIRMLDVDGDGLDDLIQLAPPDVRQYDPFAVPSQSDIRAYVNTGDALVPMTTTVANRMQDWRAALAGITTEGQHQWSAKTDVLDLNGDGLFDLAVPEITIDCPKTRQDTYSYLDCPAFTRARYAPARPLHVLKGVKNGVGASTVFEYASSKNPAVVQRGAGSNLRTPLWVVSKVTVSSGNATDQPYQWAIGPAPMVTEYKYVNPVSNFDRQHRFGFRGFEQVISTGPSAITSLRARTYNVYAYDELPTGLLKHTYVTQVGNWGAGTEDLVSVTDHTYTQLPLLAKDSPNGVLSADPTAAAAAVAPVMVYEPAASQTRTCKYGPKGIDATALAACAAASALARTVNTWTPLVAETYQAGGGTNPQLLYSQIAGWELGSSRRTDRPDTTVAPGDRIDTTFFQLRHTASDYHVLATGSERRDGTGALLAKTETTFESTPRALPTEVRVWKDASTIASTRTLAFDGYGNATRTSRPMQSALADAGKPWASRTYAYDDLGLFVVATTNELAQTTRRTVDLGTGVVLVESGLTQAGGVTPVTRTKIDGLGRTLERRRTMETAPGMFSETLVYRASYVDVAPRSVTQETLQDSSTWVTTRTFFDGLGRIIREEMPSSAGLGTVRRQYDMAGNETIVSVVDPSTGTGEVKYMTSRDGLHRPTAAVGPVGASTVYNYDGTSVSSYQWRFDGGPQRWLRLDHDGFGRLTTVYEDYTEAALNRTAAHYAYDASDRMTGIIDADGVASTIGYDLAGNRTSITRAGVTLRYDYDLHGNRAAVYHPTPTGQPDPIRYASYWTYDALDRVRSFTPMDRDLTAAQVARYFYDGTDANGAPRVSRTTIYEYDDASHRYGNGRLTKVDAPHGTTTYDYTLEGWVARERRDFLVKPEGVELRHAAAMQWMYNPMGLVTQMTHPDAAAATVSTYAYDDRGRPLSATITQPGATPVTVATFTRNEAGVVTRRDTALPGAFQTFSYDAAAHMRSNDVTAQWCDGTSCTPGVVAGEAFTYYESGDPQTVTDRAKARTLTFKYDSRVELSEARTANGDYVGTFAYSPAGRVLQVNLSSTLPGSDVRTRAVTHSYARRGSSDVADPAAVRALRDIATGAELVSMSYDASGNLTRKVDGAVTLDFVYDATDQLREVKDASGASEVYWYDHTGERVLTYRSARGSEPATLRHRFGTTEIELTTSGAARQTTVDVTLGAQPVARVSRGARNSLEYLFHGALGSLLTVVDDHGKATARFGYGPFGETLYAEGSSVRDYDRRYEAKAKDSLSGLSYFGRRYYDPLTLSWTQADPMFRFAPDLAWAEPRRMAPYTYSLNSPMSIVDPDGLDRAALDPNDTITATKTIEKQVPWVSHETVKHAVNKYRSKLVDEKSCKGDSACDQVSHPRTLERGEIVGIIAAGLPHDYDPVSMSGPSDELGDQELNEELFEGSMAPLVEGGGKPSLDENGTPSPPRAVPQYVYRGGSRSADNLTPRPGVDTGGLSTFDTLEAATSPGQKAQVIDTSKLTCLAAICDAPPDGHVSITPGSSAAISDWAASRGSGNVHPYTQELIDAIVETVRRPK